MRKISITIIILALFLPACAKVNVSLRGAGQLEPPGEEVNQNPWYILDSQQYPPVGQRCQLQNVSNDKQETSYWCWSATAQTVIKYLSGEPNIRQCDLVSAVFADKLTSTSASTGLKLDCCLVGDEYGPPPPAGGKESRIICIKTGWPEWVFENPMDKYEYSLIEYDPSSADPQGLSWEEITLQICDDRGSVPVGSPFIFTIRWWRGGGHALLVEGYRQTADGSPFLEVHDPHNPDFPDFFVMPYEAYLGVPGDFIHDRDYINILK